ncbi:hypothetical protein GBAR_LOCUS26630 [Geodia barretti]|uniref:Fibronectin type-III domain-containing protein n=1 Tax=Geodia barretti TaxID=519541 RepID=A0AA35THS0_GEOBA|nr:hypothetical protein GBAR_LOCUS26630 [Geodia barretti]
MSGREGTFRVRCTSTGGWTRNMTVSGPQYSGEEQGHMTVEPVGVPERIGNDTYTATTSTISGGCDGDIYQCNASNGAAADQLNFVELRVASDPFNLTLTQTSATSVIVEWSQPSGGATVTGYVVHYSHGVNHIIRL